MKLSDGVKFTAEFNHVRHTKSFANILEEKMSKNNFSLNLFPFKFLLNFEIA